MIMERSTPPHFTASSAIECLEENDVLSLYEFWREHERKFVYKQPELILTMGVLNDALK